MNWTFWYFWSFRQLRCRVSQIAGSKAVRRNQCIDLWYPSTFYFIMNKIKFSYQFTVGMAFLKRTSPLPRLVCESVDLKKLTTHPTSQNLAPSEYFLFPNLKKDLRGKRSSDDEGVKELQHILRTKKLCIEKLLSRSKKYTEEARIHWTPRIYSHWPKAHYQQQFMSNIG